ncbi:hypothetical protein BURPS1106B_1235 [Burkholderia pseudomallei 1106b]|nr:hypothetical protein BURPS1106B_1235 [Burkholderia pseudomallei 1106b]
MGSAVSGIAWALIWNRRIGTAARQAAAAGRISLLPAVMRP